MRRVTPIRAAALPFALLCAAPAAFAQTFATGTAVDVNNVGIVGADLDFFHQDGKESNTRNDGTGAGGAFNTEVRDGPDLYDVAINPPYGAALLPARIEDVFIVGTTNLGTITLPPGNLVEGRAIDSTGVPVVGAKVKVFDSATGDNVFIPHALTDALGEFKFALPAGTYDVAIDPTLLLGPLMAPAQRLDVVVNAGVQLGDLTLPAGYLLSATCKLGAAPIVGLDIDVIDSATHEKLYTPGDSTDALGFVDVVIPAGTFDLRFEPQLVQKIVAQELPAVVVTGNKPLGTISFISGSYLSGTVTDAGTGAPITNVDIDVIDPVSGTQFFLGSDNTDAAGFYKVVVPGGTWDVDFEANLPVDYAAKIVAGVVVAGDTTLNTTLAPCPAGVHYGSAVAGSGGFVPTVASVGDPLRLGATAVDLRISDALGGSLCFFTLGTSDASIPFKAGALLVDPGAAFYVMVALPLSGPAGVPGAGSFDVVDEIPDDATLEGVHLYVQVIVADPGAAKKVAMSDGLDLVICR